MNISAMDVNTIDREDLCPVQHGYKPGETVRMYELIYYDKHDNRCIARGFTKDPDLGDITVDMFLEKLIETLNNGG